MQARGSRDSKQLAPTRQAKRYLVRGRRGRWRAHSKALRESICVSPHGSRVRPFQTLSTPLSPLTRYAHTPPVTPAEPRTGRSPHPRTIQTLHCQVLAAPVRRTRRRTANVELSRHRPRRHAASLRPAGLTGGNHLSKQRKNPARVVERELRTPNSAVPSLTGFAPCTRGTSAAFSFLTAICCTCPQPGQATATPHQPSPVRQGPPPGSD